MAKRKKPSQAYLNELIADAQDLSDKLITAKARLYNIVFQAKLFDPEFEEARLHCLLVSGAIEANIKEQNRVQKALDKMPELPFEEK